MSANKDIKSYVTNPTPYSFSLKDKHLSSGNWKTSPQPIPPAVADQLIFEAVGVKGTMTGAVGKAEYNVLLDGRILGQMTLKFSDPYSGKNRCSGHTNVPSLSVRVECPETGGKIKAKWYILTL